MTEKEKSRLVHWLRSEAESCEYLARLQKSKTDAAAFKTKADMLTRSADALEEVPAGKAPAPARAARKRRTQQA